MKSAKVIFLIARTHGFMAHLFKTQEYTRILGTRDLQGMADYLLSTDYSRELSLIPTSEITAIQIEELIYKKLSERWFSLLETSSGETRELLEAYDERLEIENLKKVVRAVHGKGSTTTELLISIPRKYQNVNFRALSAAKSMIEVADLLKETPFRDFEKWLTEYETYNNPLILEAQLDRTYYTNFWSIAHENADRTEIKNLIGTEVDIRNLQLILSAKLMKLDPQLVRKMTINFGCRLNPSVVTRLASIDLLGIPSTVLWPSYSELMRSAVELVNEGRLVDTETLLSRYIYSNIDRVAVRNPNSLAYVFAYLSLCLREARNLTTLAIGKQMKMAQESLRILLI